MIIASVSIHRYENLIQFPVSIYDETGRTEITQVDRTNFAALVETGSIIAIGSYAKIKQFRFNRPLSEVDQIRMRFLSRAPMCAPMNYDDELADTYSVQVIRRATEFATSGKSELAPLPVPICDYERWDNLLSVAEMKAHPGRFTSELGTIARLAAYRTKHGEIGGEFRRQLRSAARTFGIQSERLLELVCDYEAGSTLTGRAPAPPASKRVRGPLQPPLRSLGVAA